MKAISSLSLLGCAAVGGAALATHLLTATAALPAPAGTNPPSAGQGTPSLAMPASWLDATMRSNLAAMTPEQRNAFLQSNRLARLAAAGGANNPIGPATPTNLAEAIIPAPRVPATNPVTSLPASPLSNNPATPIPITGIRPATTNPPSAGPGVPAIGGTNVAGRGGGTGGGVRPSPGGANTNMIVKGADEDIFPPGMIRFLDLDLSQVLEIYAEWTGRTILRAANLPALKITLRAQTPLTRREAVQALESVLAMNQITTVPIEDKFVKVVTATTAGNAGMEPVQSIENIARFGPFTTHILQLKYASPKEIMPVLTPFAQFPNSIVAIDSSQILVLRDYAENIRRMIELVEMVDKVLPAVYIPVVIPIKYALATDIQSVLGSLTQGGGGGMTVGSPTGGGMRTTGAGGRGGIGNRTTPGMGTTMPGTPGYSPGVNTPGGTTTPGIGGVGAARSQFANRLAGIIRQNTAGGGGDIQVIGMAKIIADERTNSLLVFADTNDLATISNIIDKLDVVLAQVLIDAAVAEVDISSGFSAGISAKQHQPTTTGNLTGIGAINPANLINPSQFSTLGSNGAAALSQGFTYVGQWGNDLDVTLQALANDSHSQIIQRPQLLTSHAREASLFVGQTRPYITGYTAGGGYYGNYSQYQQLQIGINLSILPFISSDGSVVMDINQTVQGIQGFASINGNDVPITSDKTATAYVHVRDHETVMLGGYMDSSMSSTHEGVPWLKDIPLLGALFKTHKNNKSRTETLLLIRPTILKTPEEAALATAKMRDSMPGMRRGFAEEDKLVREEAQKLKLEREKEVQEAAKKTRPGSMKRGE
jgi:general secretion pathway protein D